MHNSQRTVESGFVAVSCSVALSGDPKCRLWKSVPGTLLTALPPYFTPCRHSLFFFLTHFGSTPLVKAHTSHPPPHPGPPSFFGTPDQNPLPLMYKIRFARVAGAERHRVQGVEDAGAGRHLPRELGPGRPHGGPGQHLHGELGGSSRRQLPGQFFFFFYVRFFLLVIIVALSGEWRHLSVRRGNIKVVYVRSQCWFRLFRCCCCRV